MKSFSFVGVKFPPELSSALSDRFGDCLAAEEVIEDLSNLELSKGDKSPER